MFNMAWKGSRQGMEGLEKNCSKTGRVCDRQAIWA
jgi:hypothetical protein